jgi:hypothetical protein
VPLARSPKQGFTLCWVPSACQPSWFWFCTALFDSTLPRCPGCHATSCSIRFMPLSQTEAACHLPVPCSSAFPARPRCPAQSLSLVQRRWISRARVVSSPTVPPFSHTTVHERTTYFSCNGSSTKEAALKVSWCTGWCSAHAAHRHAQLFFRSRRQLHIHVNPAPSLSVSVDFPAVATQLSPITRARLPALRRPFSSLVHFAIG